MDRRQMSYIDVTDFFDSVVNRNPTVFCSENKVGRLHNNTLCRNCCEDYLKEITPSEIHAKNTNQRRGFLKQLDKEYGFVYLIKHQDYIKVGMSKDIWKRLSVQNHLFSKFQIIGLFYCKDPLLLEQRLIWMYRVAFGVENVKRSLQTGDHFYLSAYHYRRLNKYTKDFFTPHLCMEHNICEVLPMYYEYQNLLAGPNGMEVRNCTRSLKAPKK